VEWPFEIGSRYGNLASVVSLIVAVVGFGVTLWKVRGSRIAAEQARDLARESQRAAVRAQQEAREAVARVSSRLLYNRITSAIRLVRELRQACRQQQWERAIDRCEEARIHIGSLVEDALIREEEKNALGAAVDDLKLILGEIEAGAYSNAKSVTTKRMRSCLDDMLGAFSRMDGRVRSAALELGHGE